MTRRNAANSVNEKTGLGTTITNPTSINRLKRTKLRLGGTKTGELSRLSGQIGQPNQRKQIKELGLATQQSVNSVNSEKTQQRNQTTNRQQILNTNPEQQKSIYKPTQQFQHELSTNS